MEAHATQLGKALTGDVVDELKQRLSKGAYEVDPQRVADSMVSKIRLIQLARRRLGAGGQDRVRR